MVDWETGIWPRAEHLQRVFHVRSGTLRGTAFTLDVNGRQYFVSALHVVRASIDTAVVDIMIGNAWVPYVVSVIGVDGISDVAVFSLSERITAGLNIHIDPNGCVAGQEVFFLGYPLGIVGPVVGVGWPLPLIRRGIAASFYQGPPDGIYVSASSNPGFSGGPVYFVHHQSTRTTLTAIFIEALGYETDVVNANGETIGKVLTDSNIGRCVYISYALALIEANPTGFILT